MMIDNQFTKFRVKLVNGRESSQKCSVWGGSNVVKISSTRSSTYNKTMRTSTEKLEIEPIKGVTISSYTKNSMIGKRSRIPKHQKIMKN